MGKQGYVYVDETIVTYPVNSAITIAGAGIGFKEDYDKRENKDPKLILYKWWAIAKRAKCIKKKDMEVLGMIVADDLVRLNKPNHFVTPNTYFVCSEIGKYVYPYLIDHEWREESKVDRRIRKRIAESVEFTNCNSEARKYYKMKQSIGKMVTEELNGIRIPYEIMLQMRESPNLLIDAKTLEVVKLEKRPPNWSRN